MGKYGGTTRTEGDEDPTGHVHPLTSHSSPDDYSSAARRPKSVQSVGNRRSAWLPCVQDCRSMTREGYDP